MTGGRQSPVFNGPAVGRSVALRDALRAIAERRATSVSPSPWLGHSRGPGVTGAIVGPRGPGQVDGWIDAGRLTLTPDELDEIGRAVESTEAGTGPVGPAHFTPRAVPE